MRIPFAVPPAGSRPFDIIGIGENSVDLVAVVAEPPPGNGKQRLQRFARHPGGQIATALVACARLGCRSRYVGTFGSDELGRLSRESLAQEGIDLQYTRSVPDARNRFAIVIVDARSGDRSVLWDRDPALAMTADELSVETMAGGRMLLVDCQEPPVSARAARLARQSGAATAVDVEKVRPGVTDVLQHIDAIVAAESFPSELTGCGQTGDALRAMARDFDTPLVCVTLGEGGSLALCGGREIRTPAFPIDCVDTTGAGDAFRAGLVAACLADPTGRVEEALEWANAVAALNCRALGARGGLPTPAEVRRLIAGRAQM